MLTNLEQFASLFEIGFALHFAVAFIDRIYARELPVRIDRINARANSVERFKSEIIEGIKWQRETGKKNHEVRLSQTVIENPIWVQHNDQVLDRLYALRQDTTGQVKALKRILNVITFLSVLVVLYSVTMLFMIGLELDLVKGLDSMTASALVLMQLLPLPIAAAIFYFVARRMSKELDRKIRGVTELNLMLSKTDASVVKSYGSIEQIYRRDLRRNGYLETPI